MDTELLINKPHFQRFFNIEDARARCTNSPLHIYFKEQFDKQRDQIEEELIPCATPTT